MGSDLLSRAWNWTKNYAISLGAVYLDFAAPVAMFLVFNACVEANTRSPERVGVVWLHYTQQQDDKEREHKFPAYEPGSFLQHRRNEAAAVTTAATQV
jgi:hypothetical protein